MAVFDRIKGALYGVAVGDALGGPLEFMSREAVHRAYPDGLRDMVGGGWLNLKPGETTDDTAMALCVAEGIAAAETAQRMAAQAMMNSPIRLGSASSDGCAAIRRMWVRPAGALSSVQTAICRRG